MATPDQSLNYGIKVTADVTQAKVAETAIVAVDGAAKDAGKSAGEAAGAVSDLGEAATTVGTQGAAAAEGLGAVAEGAGEVATQSDKAKEALAKLEAQERAAAESTKRAASTTAASTKASRDGAQALQDIRGAATGATGGLFKVGDAFRSIGLAFRANPIGATATAIFTALPAIRAGLNAMVSEHEAALTKMHQRDSKRGEELKASLAAVAEASDREMARVTADADAAAAAYARLSAEIERTVQQYAALQSAQVELEMAKIAEEERAALAAVTSDPAREIVRTAFSRRREDLTARASSTQLENEDLNARNKLSIAEEVRIAAEAALRPLQLAAAEARAEADARTTAAGDAFRNGSSTQFVLNEQAAAREAAAAATAAETRLANATNGDIGAQVRKANEDRQAALDTLELNRIRRQTLDVGRQTVGAQRTAEDAKPVQRFNELTGERLPEAVRPVVDAAKEAAAAIKGAPQVDLREATGGIIRIGETFVAVQGENRRQFDTLGAAVKATDAKFQRELEALKARVENIRASQQ